MKIVDQAMKESTRALCNKYADLNINAFFESTHEIALKRFMNYNLKDSIYRPSRNIDHKLLYDGCLTYPLMICDKFNIKHDALLVGIASVLAYNNISEVKSIKINTFLKHFGIISSIKNLTGLYNNDNLVEEIALKYTDLTSFNNKGL